MRRREFLAGIPAATLRAAAKVPVGAHCWVYAARQPGYDPSPVLEQIFSELGKAGVDGVELMQHVLLKDDGVKRVQELSRRHGLPVLGSSWTAPMWDPSQLEKTLEEGRALIPRIRAVGGSRLGVSVGDARRKKTPQEFDAQAVCLRAVMKICAEHGVEPNLHNHVYEVADGEYDLQNTLERVPEAKLGPDLGWLFRARVDPVDFIRRHGSRMVYAHLRNEKADGKWPETLAEGVMDYGAIGKALHAAGFGGALAVELAHEKDFTPTQSYGESFRRSREFVRTAMGY
jgi:sugar phosphate isomerase/epimerase